MMKTKALKWINLPGISLLTALAATLIIALALGAHNLTTSVSWPELASVG